MGVFAYWLITSLAEPRRQIRENNLQQMTEMSIVLRKLTHV